MFIFKLFMAFHIWIYRMSKGRVLSKIAGLPLLLLTTTGRKTGQARTKPLGYFKTDNAYMVIASAGGDPKHPAWYFNLKSNPQATIEVKDQKIKVTAREASGEEYDRLWAALVKQSPAYEKYRTSAGRQIPLILLNPDR